jgi:Flp pilus assembly pilin Flp
MNAFITNLQNRIHQFQPAQASRRLIFDECGTTSVEYAVMLALIITGCIIGLTTVGYAVASHFSDAQTALDAALN